MSKLAPWLPVRFTVVVLDVLEGLGEAHVRLITVAIVTSRAARCCAKEEGSHGIGLRLLRREVGFRVVFQKGPAEASLTSRFPYVRVTIALEGMPSSVMVASSGLFVRTSLAIGIRRPDVFGESVRGDEV